MVLAVFQFLGLYDAKENDFHRKPHLWMLLNHLCGDCKLKILLYLVESLETHMDGLLGPASSYWLTVWKCNIGIQKL